MKEIEKHILERLVQIDEKVNNIDKKISFWKGSVAGVSALISAIVAIFAKFI